MLTNFSNLALDILKPKSCNTTYNKVCFFGPNLKTLNNANKKTTKFLLKIFSKDLKLLPFRHPKFNEYK